MPRLFADLHTHSSLYAFNRMRNSPELEGDPDIFHPWRGQDFDREKLAEGAHGASYSQSSFTKLTQGNVRLAIVSLTPLEREFFSPQPEEQTSFAKEALKLASGLTTAEGALKLARGDGKGARQTMGRILQNKGPLRHMLQMAYMRYTGNRVKYVLSAAFDYWDEYHRELSFLRSRDGIRHAPAPHRDGYEDEVAGCYHLIRDRGHLRETIENTQDIAVVLSIEGAHVFSVGAGNEPAPLELMLERIAALKAQPEPLLVLTTGHHFDNALHGHARSLPGIAAFALDQSARLNSGFERENDRGLRVVRELLDLDDDGNDRGGRRIVLDVKHMSPRTRKEYYAEVIEPFNTNPVNADRRIPIVGSHVSYSGRQTLDQLIADEHRESDGWQVGAHYAWGINLCDEDVQAIHDSRGVAGFIFDRRVSGVSKHVPEAFHVDTFLAQLIGFVDAVYTDDTRSVEDRRRVWDCLTIGSDFDGMIHPVPRYATAALLDRFAEDLRDTLQRIAHTRQIAQIGVDELVEKICWRNLYEFALRHLPEAPAEG
ncbi:MAG: hypothetical protein ACI8PZ_003281 [Myxococcota bacterium]|jgi:hypothetical protein